MAPLSVVVLLAFCVVSASTADLKGYYWHFTDAHYQPQYYEGASEISGCISGEGIAGPFGAMDAPCDTPQLTMESTFEFMKLTHPKPDFIVYTGDMLPHNALDADNAAVIQYQNNLTYYMQKYFPGVTVFPLLGNHDTMPRFQMYDYEYWLFDDTAQVWSAFLDDDMQATFKKGGYYTSLVVPGLRIVALNTALLYYHNAYVDPKTNPDPAGMFSWMTQVLNSAVINNEKVLLIYHIPLGYVMGMACQMYENYNNQMIKFLEPYHNIILGHLNGHDHFDFYRLVGDLTPSGTSVSLTAGAVTPYDLEKPKIRLFQYSPQAPFTMLDYTSYMMNLHESNIIRTAVWTTEYQARSEYDIADLTSTSMIDLWGRMQTNDTLLERYLRHWKGVEWVGEICNPFDLCRKDVLCSIAYTTRVPLVECLA